MPVMIRHNIATELCITKGQKGTVAGWDSKPGPYGKEMLETLFMKLTEPLKFNDLPLNVVPIVKMASSVKCRLVDDQVCSVNHLQVLVLPNFAMTDYASQGKTRPDNVVDLTHCTSHQSYYTVLSRSALAAGTVIVQIFSPGPITGGVLGWLRQEFHKLEILDEITTLAYNSSLPDLINAQIRNVRITPIREWKGPNYVPKKTYKPITWSLKKPYKLTPIEKESQWKLINKKPSNMIHTTGDINKSDLIAANGGTPIKGFKSRRS